MIGCKSSSNEQCGLSEEDIEIEKHLNKIEELKHRKQQRRHSTSLETLEIEADTQGNSSVNLPLPQKYSESVVVKVASEGRADKKPSDAVDQTTRDAHWNDISFKRVVKIVTKASIWISFAFLVFLFIRIVTILAAFFCMTYIKPEDVVIDKLVISGLCEASMRMDFEAQLPKTFLSESFKFIVQETDLKIGFPDVSAKENSRNYERLVHVHVPTVILGKDGHHMKLDGLKVDFNTNSSLQSLFDHFRTINDDEKKIDFVLSTRITSRSLLIPLNFPLNISHTLSISDIMENIELNEIPLAKPKLHSLRMVPHSKEASFHIHALVTIPPMLMVDFMQIDVPEMAFDVLHSLNGPFERFAKVKRSCYPYSSLVLGQSGGNKANWESFGSKRSN